MRDDVVAHARGWIGTRFHHQGRLKKTDTHRGGVDCLGLLIGVVNELDLRLPDGSKFSDKDEAFYSHYPDTQHLREVLAEVMQEIPIEGIEMGDVALLSVDNNPQHLAIISDAAVGLGMIHAYAPARAVVEHGFDEWWRKRTVTAFRIA